MKKIAIIVISLAGGGAEKSNSLISSILHEIGHEIFIYSFSDKIDYEYNGKFIPLGNQKTKNIVYRKLSKLVDLYQSFRNENFDLIIDGRSRPTFLKELIFKKLIFKNTPKICIIRSSNLATYFPKYSWQAKYLYKKSLLISVSKRLSSLVNNKYDLPNTHTIYNPIFKEKLILQSNAFDVTIREKYILFYGRFHNKSKNIFFLLEAYKKSKLPQNDIKLLLIGKGPDEKTIKNKIEQLNLTRDVVFKKHTSNPMPFVKKALFITMTSNYEGFPRAITEALSLAVPVVTLDFISGPSEIIITGKNGILVSNKTTACFAKALDRMIFDLAFYNECKKGTQLSAEKFESYYITKKWKEFISKI